MEMKLVMRAGDIPDNVVVTKVTGEVRYVLVSHITIYADKNSRPDNVPQVLQSEGVKFLMDSRGHVNCIPCDKELLWHVEEDTLLRFLEDRNEPQK